MPMMLHEITSKGYVVFQPENNFFSMATINQPLCHIQVNLGVFGADGFYFFHPAESAMAAGLLVIWAEGDKPLVQRHPENETFILNTRGYMADFNSEIGQQMAEPPPLDKGIIFRFGLWDGSLWNVREDGSMFTMRGRPAPPNNLVTLVPNS